MDKSDKYNEIMLALKAPYKTSSAYEKYGEPQFEKKAEDSTFWSSHLGYVEKYDSIGFPGSKKRQS